MKKRQIKKVSGSKYVYTGKPSELSKPTSSYAYAIIIIAAMLILAGFYREYVRP